MHLLSPYPFLGHHADKFNRLISLHSGWLSLQARRAGCTLVPLDTENQR